MDKTEDQLIDGERVNKQVRLWPIGIIDPTWDNRSHLQLTNVRGIMVRGRLVGDPLTNTL